MNTIDFTLYNGYPISDSGYIPDKGIIMNNLDELLLDEAMRITSEDNIKKCIQIDDIDFRILFLQKSKDHKFSKPYLDFLKFCLSMMHIGMDGIDIFFLEPDLMMSLKESNV